MKKAFIIFSLIAVLCSPVFARGAAEKEPDLVRVTVVIDEPNAESFLFWVSNNAEYLDMCIEPFIGNDPITGEFDGSRIVKSWEHNEDFTEWIFHLRKGVQFHNDWGEATAEDVVHSFNLQTGNDAIIAGIEQVRGGRATAIDRYTVKFEFPSPRRDFPFNVSSRSTMHLYSKAQYDEGGIKAYEEEPTGTGHYEYVRHEPGRVIYRAVDDHYSGITPGFKELELVFVSESSTRLAMLQTGEADIAELPRELLKSALAAGMEIVYSHQPSMQTNVVFNGLYMTSEEVPEIRKTAVSLPWADVRIREAINIAIDRKEMLEVLFDNEGASLLPKYGMHEPHEGYVPELAERFPDEYGYDPVRARRLIEEAGYPDAFADPKIPLIRTAIHGQPELDVQTDLLYEYFTEVGLQPEIVEMDSASMFGLGRSRQLFYLNPNRNAPPRPTEAAILAFYNRPGGPAQGYETDKSVGLVRKIVDTNDVELREKLYEELFTYLFESYSEIPLFELYTAMAVNPDVVGEWNFPGATTYGYGSWHLIQPAR